MSTAMESTPRGGKSPARFPTGVAVVFYLALGAAGWGWRLWADGVGPWRAHQGPIWPWPMGVALGAVIGLVLVGGSRTWTRHSRAGEQLRKAMAEAVSGLAAPALLVLALASGIAEEVFFRGALQPRVGWFWASLAFGAAHFVPERGLRVWSLMAGLAGLLFAGLYEWTGSLAAPIAAHITVNAMNLRWLASSARAQDG